jgi:hypothetical protein
MGLKVEELQFSSNYPDFKIIDPQKCLLDFDLEPPSDDPIPITVHQPYRT